MALPCDCNNTRYPELPKLDPPPPGTLLNSIYAANKLLELTDPETAKSVFIIIGAESSKNGDIKTPLTYSFRSAGGHNYTGVQTDCGRWSAPGIVARFCRFDGKKNREFAAFTGDAEFLAFMADRVKAKGFRGSDGNAWTERYLNDWVFKDLKSQNPTLYNQYFPDKLKIYNTYARLFDKVTTGQNQIAYKSGAVQKSTDSNYQGIVKKKEQGTKPLFSGVPGVLAYLSLAGIIFLFFKKRKKA